MDDLVQAQQREIAMLRERVRQLEHALSPSVVAIDMAWQLTSSEARVFACLATRAKATKEMILQALYSDRPDDAPEPKIVDVFVCKLRKKLKPFGIEITTVWGQGYSLADRCRYVSEPRVA
ncbi:helix-turn-helix domain-containing protein [Shinella pollutisoli]|uniref:Helix-turn-helix domain-containing protein n=1 Tax=Shinella pollutisoli TaxID=2250594 RepID=A0ABV7DKP3_9HYPH|nr:helix-turn-helix domain-containing protein [Shinella pollutisoli]